MKTFKINISLHTALFHRCTRKKQCMTKLLRISINMNTFIPDNDSIARTYLHFFSLSNTWTEQKVYSDTRRY